MGYAQAEKRVSIRSMWSQSERDDDLPVHQAPFSQPKKRVAGASERDEWLRVMWRSTMGKLDGKRLMFVDEMGTHTSLAPSYAYAPRGKRAFFKVPRNRGKNVTLLASIGSEGMGPSMAFEGSTTKEVFEAYVEHFLTPASKAGQIVIMDNLAAHKGEKVRKLIEVSRCELLYLPPYSPDLNPIEEAISKVKGFLRKAGARSRKALVEAMGAALAAVGASDARGFFEHCGYYHHPSYHETPCTRGST